jgi:putative flippase GtrA
MERSVKNLPWRPARFAIVGVVNTIVGLSVIYLCKFVLNLSDVPANVLGYAVGLVVSFYLNSIWTFAYRGLVLLAALRFLMAFLISYGINLATVLILIEKLGVNSYLAQAAGIPAYTVAFYLLSKTFVFGAKGSAQGSPESPPPDQAE